MMDFEQIMDFEHIFVCCVCSLLYSNCFSIDLSSSSIEKKYFDKIEYFDMNTDAHVANKLQLKSLLNPAK